MRTVQSKRELGWGLGPEQDPFTVTLSVWETGSRTAMEWGMSSLRRAALSSVQGSTWPIVIRTGTPFPTTNSAWHRTIAARRLSCLSCPPLWKARGSHLPSGTSQFFRSSIGSHIPLPGQHSLNASVPSIRFGYQDTCETLRKVSGCIGQGSVMVPLTVSHSQGTSSWTNNSYKDSCQTLQNL